MPRSLSSVMTRAAARSAPVSVLSGASQTFRTPSCGAIQASCVPSGEMLGETRCGLPNRTGSGMRSGICYSLSRDSAVAGAWLTVARARRLTQRIPPKSYAASPLRRQVACPPELSWQTGRMEGHPQIVVDLDAISANVAAIAAHVGGAQVMAVVKSDGYGHGMLASATAALAGGATWLGVVQVADALALRQAGVTVPVLCLLGAPDVAHEEA